MPWVERHIAGRAIAIDPTAALGVAFPTASNAPREFPNAAAVVEWLRAGKRHPGIVQWELLSSCNFKCPFCYIVGHSQPTIFPTERALRLVAEMIDCGVVYLILSGGEPLLHPNFREVYESAKRGGLLTTVYSNLWKLSDTHVDMFAELPPAGVEVSLYGKDESSYERATGRRAFERVLANIHRLKEIGVDVLCKTPITSLTAASIDWLRDWCASQNIPYVTTANIEDGLDGTNLSEFRIDYAAWRHTEVDRLVTIRTRTQSSAKELPDRDTRSAYSCGVGKVGAYVGYEGSVYPCALTRGTAIPLLEHSFSAAWNSLLERVIPVEGSPILGCNPLCRAKAICKMCPARALVTETGAFSVDPAYCDRTIDVWDAMARARTDTAIAGLPREAPVLDDSMGLERGAER